MDLDALPADATACADKSDAFRLYRIGDAVSSRDIHAAIFDGNRPLRAI